MESSPGGARLDDVNAAVDRLLAADSESIVCERAVEALSALFDTESCGLWLSEGQRLQLTASSGGAAVAFDATVVDPGGEAPLDGFEGEGVLSWNECDEDRPVVHAEPHIASELVAPIGDYGILTVGSTEGDAFDDADEEVVRLLSTTAEAALRNADHEHTLRLKNRRLEEFVKIVSHDVRNPLNVALASLESLRGDCDSEHVEGVEEGLSRIDALIDDMLVLADQGYVVEKRTALDLATLAERAWETVDTRDATLRTDATTTVFGDTSRLRQVFENLFRNAVEHGGEDVEVRVAPVDSFHTSTRVRDSAASDGFYVADDGRGIPADERASVFDRGHSSGGTGLGLAIVDRIISSHGWEIACEESRQGGARFTVTGDAKTVSPFEES